MSVCALLTRLVVLHDARALSDADRQRHLGLYRH